MKKFITVFAVLLFAVTLGFSQADIEKHCICGKSECSSTEHDCTLLDFSAITASADMPTTTGKYYLYADKEISETWVPADGTVLCLSGHVLKYTGSGSVIQINPGCSFTLTDCKDTKYYLTDSNGDGCYETYSTTKPSGDSIEVTGGLITGGKGQLSTILLGGYDQNKCGQSGYVINGGGISNQGVSATGAIFIHGGEISGNTAKTARGGGICSNAQVVLDNVALKNNSAYDGGGICVAVFDTTGSAKLGENTVITGNTATSGLGGAFYFNGNTNLLSVSSNVTITGNKDKDGDEHNVYLQSGKYITVEDGFNGTIGVTTQTRPSDDSYIQVTKATNKQDYSACFIPDYLDDSINTGSGSTQAVKFKPHEHKFEFSSIPDDTLQGYCTDSRCPLSIDKEGEFTSTLKTNMRILATTVNDDASDTKITWSSSDEDKVKINSDGEVVGLSSTGPDGVTITATANDGSGKTASINIVVD